MATLLTTPITVTNDQGLSGQATHEQVGATVQPWNDPPVVVYSVVGTIDERGNFIPMNGTRSDNDKPSPHYMALNKAEFNQLSKRTTWMNGLKDLMQVATYVDSGRKTGRPAWLAPGS